jgi:hypothetical protein
MGTETNAATTDLATIHAELIKSLKSASNHLSNAAYFLEHPEFLNDRAKSLESAQLRARAGLTVADVFVREQISALQG